MKFSYSLIKKYIPKINKKELIDTLNYFLFEAEFLSSNTLDISVAANRFNDCSGHFGIIKELSIILNKKNKLPHLDIKKIKFRNKKNIDFEIKINNKVDCLRYLAQYYQNIVVKSSPNWLKKILKENGLRPINNIVDLMNYVMLEIGQPLHAFDADKLFGKKIIVRRAYHQENFKSIDGLDYVLDDSILVIADKTKAQAIAGIKGGWDSQIKKNTKNILVEAATFNPCLIYQISKKIGLITDASLRFSHGLDTALALLGLKRLEMLMKEIYGFEPTWTFDSLKNYKVKKRVFIFDLNKFVKFSGLNLSLKEVENILKKIDFKKIKGNLWEAPILRTDIENIEDVYEEIIRIYGLNKIQPQPSKISLSFNKEEDFFVLREKIINLMINFGFSEAYNYSFDKFGEIEILNPVSLDKKYLRNNLFSFLIKNIENNLRFFEEVRIFEVGKVFLKQKDKILEINQLGVGLFSKKEEKFFELKGIVIELLKALNFHNFNLILFEKKNIEDENELIKGFKIEVDNEIIGIFGKNINNYNLFVLELDKILLLLKEEFEFKPIPKFPSVVRDISILVDKNLKVGELIDKIKNIDLETIYDIDLIDEYFDKNWLDKQSLTFRIVFQKNDRTLTNEEVNTLMIKIEKMLKDEFNCLVR